MMQLKKLMALLSRHVLLMLVMTVLAIFVGMPILPVSAESMAFVRVVHASPDAGNVDVYVDGSKLLDQFKFGTVTGYVSVPAGAHKIQVTPAGQGVGAAVITQTASVEAGVPYTIAALGTKSSGFSLQAFADNNLISNGMVKVRVYHLSPDAGPVNVAAGGNTVISGLTYQHVSEYLLVPPASYTFRVTATQSGAVVPVAANLKAATVTSVFAVGLLNGSPKISFVAAQVTGVPGMPGTGSDPNAMSSNLPLQPWLAGILGALLLVAVGAGACAYRFAVVRQKTGVRSR